MALPTTLNNHFLIAMPGLEDPNFVRTVTFICEHNENGAMGIIINRPLDMDLGEIFSQMQIQPDSQISATQRVFYGGPVQQERGFVLHTPAGNWESSFSVSRQITVTTSRDILSAIAHDRGPEEALIALGYAGWGAGQLEQELADNAWLSAPATPEIIFGLPHEERWQAAAAEAGVDIRLISSDIGHA